MPLTIRAGPGRGGRGSAWAGEEYARRVTVTQHLEFWPDYGGVLLHDRGAAVPLDRLPLPADLVDRASTWVAGYDDTRLPFGDSPDDAWSREGRALFAALREALAPAGIAVEDWEGIWSSEP